MFNYCKLQIEAANVQRIVPATLPVITEFLLLLQRAGYSLQELFMLSRSHFNQQRMLALSTLANILSKVHTNTCQVTMPYV